MKKFALLLMFVFTLIGCEVNDDGQDSIQVLVEVTDADLPDFFEKGKVYQIDVTYLLPDACHTALGLQAVRGAAQGDESREIYVAGVASRPANETDCTLQDEDLAREGAFTLRIDEDEPYTFYLWTGLDENDENVYTEITVPVGETTTAGAE